MSTLSRATDLLGLLNELEITVVRETDREILAFCPMHEKRVGRPDRHPSWSINRLTGEHHCFSCEFGGSGNHSLQALISEVAGVSGWAAGEILSKYIGIEALKRVDLPTYERAPTKSPSIYSESVLDKFKSPPVSALRKRRIDEESAEHYGVLWDPGWQAWVFPIREETGWLRGVQLKKGPVVRNRPKNDLYRRDCLFGSDVFPRGQRALLVESPLDVLRFHTVGFDGALATLGSGVSEEQMSLLMALTDHVVLALDNDDAGKRTTTRLVDRYSKEIKHLRVFDYGTIRHHKDAGRRAKDPGEMSDEDLMWALKHSKNALLKKLEAASV